MRPKRSASTASPGKKTSPTKKTKLSSSSGQLSLDRFFKFAVSGSSSAQTFSPNTATADGKLIIEEGKTKSISNDTLSLEEELQEKPLELDLSDNDSDIEILQNFIDGTTNKCGQSENYPSTSKSMMLTVDEGPRNGSSSSSLELSIGVTSQTRFENYPDLAIDPLNFTIDLDDAQCQWSSASYSFLVHALSTLSNTRSRIAIINTLTNYLRCIISRHPSSLIPSLYLLTNSLGPPYLAVELGLGPSILTKAIQQVSGLSAAALSKLYKSLGDPGDVAFAAKSSIRTLIPHPPLTIINVYETMLKIARTQGQGSVKTKQKLVEKLLLSAKGEESRYLVRTLCQNLRVGAVRNSIISALARAMVFIKPPNHDDDVPESSTLYITPPRVAHTSDEKGDITRADKGKGKEEIVQLYLRAEGILKHAFVIHPNLDDIAEALLDGGLSIIPKRITLSVGIPLHPTLGSPARSLDEIYERLQDQAFAAELKYDGQRAQIHAFLGEEDGKVFVKIFSRHLEDMTEKYPDVVALVQRLISRSLISELKISSFIIDSEIVAVDPDTGDLKSFQDLSQRARKDVSVEDIKVLVGVYAYDIMYLNGDILIGSPFRQRRNFLYTYLPAFTPETKTIARFCHAQKRDSEEGQEAIEEFWATAVNGRAEGLMIKVTSTPLNLTNRNVLQLLDHGEVNVDDAPTKSKSRRKPLPASYEPDKRTLAWIKLKKDYVEGLGDSLDMVPIGAWHGNGRKAAWWSPVLLAVWDPSQEEFVAVCKCMSGFSDAFYKEMKRKYAEDSEYCSITSKWNANVGGFSPSVYFKPSEVWEIRGADITLSPVSVAARELVARDKGLSLRFPRFMKVRSDKNLEQASSTAFLANLWRQQEKRGKENNKKHVDEGDLVEPDWNSDEGISSDADEDGDDAIWAGFWGLIYRKFFWDFVSGILRFPGGLQPAANDKIFIDIIVKAPVVQILSILVAFCVLALELGLPPPLKKTALYRSWTVRVVILVVQAFLAILFYQGTNAALYSTVAAIGYTMAQIRGESTAEAHGNKGREGKA